MKYFLTLLTTLTLLFVVASPVKALTLLFPSGGGTGIGTAPTYGQLLVGNSGGTYTLTATSSLGISGGGSSTFGTSSLSGLYPVIYTQSPSLAQFSLAFGTTTSNSWAGTQTFVNAVATTLVRAPYIYGGDMTTTYANYTGGIFGGTATHGVLDFVDNNSRIGEFYTTATAFNFFSEIGRAHV